MCLSVDFISRSMRSLQRDLLNYPLQKNGEFRLKLWNEYYDPTLSRNDIINNVPRDVPEDQWALFVNYRLKPETMELCKRNQEIRKKQTIPHCCGAKSLGRRQDDVRIEIGKTVGRGPMWNITHKRKDGIYVNEEAKEIGEKIDKIISQNSGDSSENSPNDALGVGFGKEHPGGLRGMGLGAVPTIAFKHTTMRLSGMNFGSSSGSTSSPHWHQKVESQLQAVLAYITAKKGGRIPDELAGLFPDPIQQASDVGSGAPLPNNLRRSSDASNTHQSVDHPSPH